VTTRRSVGFDGLTCWVALPSSRCRECDIQAVSATDVDHVRHVRPVVSSDRIAQISATRPWFDSRRLEFASSSTLAPGECQAREASGAAPRPRSTESMAPMKLQSSSRESPLSGNFDARRPITPGQGWRNPVDAMDSSDWPRGDGARRGTCAAPQKPLPSGRSPSRGQPRCKATGARDRPPTHLQGLASTPVTTSMPAPRSFATPRQRRLRLDRSNLRRRARSPPRESRLCTVGDL
jgi:hypothetical protein